MRRHTLSVRLRITAAVALMTAVALLATGLTSYVVELRRIDEEVAGTTEQEIDEFDKVRRAGPEGDEQQRFSSIGSLLRTYLLTNVPGPNELIFGYDGTDVLASAGEGSRTLAADPAFRDAVSRLRDAGGSDTIETGLGTTVVAVQDIRRLGDGARPSSGAFVVAHLVGRERSELYDVTAVFAVVATISWLLLVGVASLVAGRLLRPVRRLRATAQSIADGDLSQRIEVSGNDDLSALTRTFNEMLERLDGAFTTQRQLLDDAGHELRTPLTVLRGHLELIDGDDPEDVAATRALLLDEIDRMSRLVDELLLLAKAERPDFVTPEPCDLDDLVPTVMDKCRALGLRDWVVDEAAPGTLFLDPQRVTQAVLQLAANAVRHTRRGDQIGLGARVRGDHVEIWVRDTGEGVDPADRDVVFDRFRRGGTTSDDQGFGLGLSIVSAIAHAHGGWVVLDDPPVGATFRLVLPAVRADALFPTTTGAPA